MSSLGTKTRNSCPFLFCCVRAVAPPCNRGPLQLCWVIPRLTSQIFVVIYKWRKRRKWFQVTFPDSANLHSPLPSCCKRPCIKYYWNSALGRFTEHKRPTPRMNRGLHSAGLPHGVSHNSWPLRLCRRSLTIIMWVCLMIKAIFYASIFLCLEECLGHERNSNIGQWNCMDLNVV